MIDSLETQLERLATQLAEDDHREISALFRQARLASPQLIWTPQPGQAPGIAMPELLARWELGGGRRRAATGEDLFDGAPAAMRDWAIELDLRADGDVSYARVGERIVGLLRSDPTGQSLIDVVSRTPTPAMMFYAAGYLACRWRQAPFLTFSQSPRLQVRAVSRLVLPLWDPDGLLRRFATLLSIVDHDAPSPAN